MSKTKAARIVGIYCLLAGLWILFSDKLVAGLGLDINTSMRISMYKGWFFVAVTAVLLFLLIRRMENSLKAQTLAAKRSESEYRLLVESMTDMVVKVDANGVFKYVNPAYCELFGKQEHELLGHSFMPLVHEEDREPTRLAMLALFQPPYTAYLEQRAMTKLGWRWLSWMDTAVLDDSGQVSEIIGLGRDITEHKASENKIRRALEEKDLLLKEIHHRVKNNLQIVMSLLNLQIESVKTSEDREVFRRMQSRIRAMALIHERLYRQGDFSAVDMAGYLPEMIGQISESYSRKDCRVEVVYNLQSLTLGIDRAIPCGLLINELVTNAFKHAFVGRANGRLEIGLSVEDGLAIFKVCDNGLGLPENFAETSQLSLGQELIRALTGQLKGELRVSGPPGASFEVRFQVQLPEAVQAKSD